MASFLFDGYLTDYSFWSYIDLFGRRCLRHRRENLHHRRAGDPVWDFVQLGVGSGVPGWGDDGDYIGII